MRDIQSRLEGKRNAYAERLNKFKEKLDTNPVYAFEWSRNAFEAAAWIQEATKAIEALQNGSPIDTIIDYFKRQVMSGAISPASSTSVTSNYMETCLLSVRAKIVEMLEAEQEVTG